MCEKKSRFFRRFQRKTYAVCTFKFLLVEYIDSEYLEVGPGHMCN